MQTYKSTFKEKDLKLYESINKQFLSKFPKPPKGIPRAAILTCDLHLESKQPLLFVDPKGNGTKEIYWEEPKDLKMYWIEKEKWLWGGITISASFFFIIVYYFWGNLVV